LIFSFNLPPERTDVDEEGWSGRPLATWTTAAEELSRIHFWERLQSSLPQIPPPAKWIVKTYSSLNTMASSEGELQPPTAGSSSAKNTSLINGGGCSSSRHRICLRPSERRSKQQ
jgi:hypothetical protein